MQLVRNPSGCVPAQSFELAKTERPMRQAAIQRLRFRPGDIARVIHSINPALIDQIVVILAWRPDHGRWAVRLLSGPILGVTLLARQPVLTTEYGFRDSSLEPLPRTMECRSQESLVACAKGI